MDNISLGKRIETLRKSDGMTQGRLAKRLGISAQAVSSWELGKTAPDIDRIAELTSIFGTTGEYLLEGREKSVTPYAEKLFNEEHMYSFVKGSATGQGLTQTLQAMSYAREKHKGQKRKGSAQVPYIVHPLNMACQAMAMRIDSDDVLAAIMLHDVCEDCDVSPEDLPVGDVVKRSVSLLTKNRENYRMDRRSAEEQYYQGIAQDSIASLVKLFDRCNNVSFMAYAFSRIKLMEYISETRTYVLPLTQVVKNRYPKYSDQAFLLKYHICSVIGSIEAAWNCSDD